MKKRLADSLRRPERKRYSRRKPSASSTSRMLEFEEKLLQLKLAGPEERIHKLAEFARNESLTTAERRQVLMATRKYILARRSELPADLSGLLTAVLQLANKRDLRTKALALFRQSLEAMSKKDVVGQIVGPLEQLLKGFLPRASKQSFSPELFKRVAQRMESSHDVSALVDVTSLGLFFFPFHGPLRELRADYQFMGGNPEGAEHDFAQLVEQYPERHEYRLDHAEALLHLDDFEGALSEVRIYLRIVPDEPNALRIEAECLAQTGRGNDAMRIYARLIEQEGESVDLLLSRARTLEQMDLYDEAIADTERVLELDRENSEAKHFRQSLIMRRQSYGMEDDLYSAYSRGDESVFLGDSKIPETTFADVGGLDRPKQLIKETILYPLKYKELSQRYGKKAGGGILLFGPPGCGKTLLARAAAGECGVSFINVNLSTVLDKWVGNTEKAVSMIFSSARKQAPSIVFLDEVDAIGGSRANLQAGWEKKLISQLLVELDGLTSDNRDVMLLAASNAPWDVDFALRRPGRLGSLVFVPPPEPSERAEIIRLYLNKKPYVAEDIDYAGLGDLTGHYSADALRQLVEDAAAIPWREAIESGVARPISHKDLLAALEQSKPDLTEWEKLVASYKEFADRSHKRAAIGFKRPPQNV